MTEMQLNLYRFIIECVETVRARVLQVHTLSTALSCELLVQVDEIFHFLIDIPCEKISDQQKVDVYCEINRFFALANLFELKTKFKGFKDFERESTLNDMYKNCQAEILCLNKFEQARSKAVETLLEDLQANAQKWKPKGLTPDERAMIRMAISKSYDGHTNQQGHWYKCKNGHFYYIGNCGHAVGAGTCPECKTPIGASGGYGNLASGNQYAPEMLR